MPTPLFFGEVKNGKLELVNRQALAEYIKTLEGKRVQVQIDKRKRPRSTGKPWEKGNQNGYYRGVILPIVSEYVGERPNTMHEILLDLFAPRVQTEILGIKKLTIVRTRNMTTVQFKEFCDAIIQVMAEHGVVIPEPTSVA